MRVSGDGGPVFITGFMGAGKSSVGRELARFLKVPFLDLDDMVKMRCRLGLEEIFSRHGESFFRGLEREALEEAAGLGFCVVSLGGGALMDRRNLELVLSSGRLVALKVPLEVAEERLRGGATRPLLGSASLEELFQRRRSGYEAAEVVVDAHPGEPIDVAKRIAEALSLSPGPWIPPVEMRSAPLDLTVRVLCGDLCCTGPFGVLGPRVGGLFLVGDYITGPLFAGGARRDLMGFHLFPRGEAAKDLRRVEELYDAMEDGLVRRDSTVVAVGGGAVGDVAAFGAATYLRGVGLVQCPTTLLSQVDSSIGGKCAVNRPRGKNLVGTFAFPSLVICDVGCLMSLSEGHYRQGLGEVAKYALLHRKFLAWLLENARAVVRRDREALAECVRRCVKLKLSVVEKDPFERNGLREVLNLGHTIGHAIEKLMGFEIGHGDAVASSLMVDLALSERLGLGGAGLRGDLLKLLESLGLPSRPKAPWGELEEHVGMDKKWGSQGIRMPLPTRDGVMVKAVGMEDIKEAYLEVLYGA